MHSIQNMLISCLIIFILAFACFAGAQETGPTTAKPVIGLPTPTESDRAYVRTCFNDTERENDTLYLPRECHLLVEDPAREHDPAIKARVTMLQNLFRDMVRKQQEEERRKREEEERRKGGGSIPISRVFKPIILKIRDEPPSRLMS